MSNTPPIKSFADLARHMGIHPGAGERQRPAAHDARPGAARARGRRPETAAASSPWIGWHAARNAFYVLPDDEPEYVVRILNVGSKASCVERIREPHGRIAASLEHATDAEAAIVLPLYEAYRRDRHPAVLVDRHIRRATEGKAAMEQRFQAPEYIRLREAAALGGFAEGSESALEQARLLSDRARLEQTILELQRAAKAVPDRIAQHNEAYVHARLERYREFFDTVEAKPLTDCQRRAAVIEEDRHLVVAGAGTGKTSTIVARVAYLVQHQAVPPAQVLVLAYNQTVQGEIRGRLARAGIPLVLVETFHGFGMQVIAEEKGYKPPVSDLAKQPGPRREMIRRALKRLQANERVRGSLIRFFTEERYSAHSEPIYQTLGEYLAATRRPRYLTLDGRFRVKSLAELKIADWLCVNGVEYEYEPRYPHLPPSRTSAGYRPDFFLPAYGVYIEHFGIDRQNRTAAHIDRDNYLAGMEWKRRLHKAHGTPLVKTYGYESSSLGPLLKSRLSGEGVRFTPRSDEEVLELITRHHASRFVGLVERFLLSFRDNLWTLDRVRSSPGYAADRARTASFLDIFAGVLGEYEGALARAGEIDFSSMIGLATEAIQAGTYPSRFTHIVIDEFQDISRARCGLVRALLDQPGAERTLFAVGDDWQSIYRFAGSDVSIMARFEDHLGPAKRTSLDYTFRFSDRLAELSRTFIIKNREQIDKQLSARAGEGPAATVIHGPDAAGLRRALEAIEATPFARPPRVLLLSRNNLSEQQAAALRAVWTAFPGLTIEPKTIHKAKGSEADFVILLSMSSAQHGFPSDLADDPLLSLLVPDCGSFPDSEERRLFYVALTRAHRHVYLVAPPEAPSRFVTELLSPEYAGLVELVTDAPRPLPCAVCRTGTLVGPTEGSTRYWTCSNHPGCDRRVPPCRVCGRAPLVPGHAELRCASPACSHRERMCPRCGGQLVEREKNGSRFLGCSEWRRYRAGCYFTESLSPV